MNEFVAQFLLESRELVEQATGDLLALEENPADAGRLDSAFRAFHTLKGGAGIVDFDAMGRALHAAEDVLAAVRTGSAPVTADLIGACLTCLDQVVQWLDAMEVDGEIPPGADAAADAVVARFGGEAGKATPPESAVAGPDDWSGDLVARHPDVAGQATVAVRYEPDPGCFFRGDDPLAVLTALPGVLAVEISPRTAWGPLDAFDPFSCGVVLAALSMAPADEIASRLAAVGEQAAVKAIRKAPAAAQTGFSATARAILEAQVLLLAERGAAGLAGRLAAAGRVAVNVLTAEGLPDLVAEVDRALAKSLDDTNPDLLVAVLEAALGGAAPSQGQAPETTGRTSQEIARVLRVDVERIDALVKLAGELTVVKNALGHAAGLAQAGSDPKTLAGVLKDQHAQLERLVGELQRSVLNIRVLPLGQVFQRFPRLVREMAAGLGKPVQLVTEGEATEADKAVVEALFEPLLHVLRNAIDHGVEGPATRAALGKPAAAVLRLRAFRDGEQVLIEVEDDGGGIDIARVRQVAGERGVVGADVLAAMDDEAAADLIFAPGFSTARIVTGLSGRGVGMDAVRTAIQRMGGRVAVTSRPGLGTTVRFAVPFTLMMSAVMTVEAGGQMFGVPLDAVVETVRIPRNRIAPIGAARAFVLRDRTIPLIDLAEAVGASRDETRDGDANVVVASVGGQVGGLEVDRLGERMDVMLKPMDGLLAGMPGIAGTTLLGDGRVLIVLDLEALLS